MDVAGKHTLTEQFGVQYLNKGCFIWAWEAWTLWLLGNLRPEMCLRVFLASYFWRTEEMCCDDIRITNKQTDLERLCTWKQPLVLNRTLCFSFLSSSPHYSSHHFVSHRFWELCYLHFIFISFSLINSPDRDVKRLWETEEVGETRFKLTEGALHGVRPTRLRHRPPIKRVFIEII